MTTNKLNVCYIVEFMSRMQQHWSKLERRSRY